MNNKKIGIGLIALLALIGLSVVFFYSAVETVAVNSMQSSGQIYFLENLTHGTENIGETFTDPKNNITKSSSVGIVETGIGRNTFTMTYKNINDERFDRVGAKYTLTVIDTDGITHTTTKEVDRTAEGSISVTLDLSQSGIGHYLLESTIVETRVGFLGRE
jgi:hypothetical protein